MRKKSFNFLLIFTTKTSHTSLPVFNRFAPLTLTQTTPFTFSMASLPLAALLESTLDQQEPPHA
jgi:hypothetical protein